MPTTSQDRDVFSGLAHPTRRAILDQLSQRPLPVGELAESFDVSLPAISRHLRLLRESGLVRERIDGRYRVYEFRSEPLEEVVSWLLELQGFWEDRLGSLRRYLDERHRDPKEGS